MMIRTTKAAPCVWPCAGSRNAPACFWGLTGTLSYTIEFDQLVAGPGSITMEQTLHTPGLGCGGSFSNGFPHVFLRVDRVAAADQVDAVTTEIQAAPCP